MADMITIYCSGNSIQDDSCTLTDSDHEDEDVQLQESQIPLDNDLLTEACQEQNVLDSYEGEYDMEFHGTGDPVLSPDMRICRNGFISGFRHSKMGMATREDVEYIADSRHYLRWADSKLDACLYEQTDPDAREDNLIYEELYGLQPAIVDLIDYEPTIRALNQHAMIISSEHIFGTDVFYDAFWRFIDALEESWFAADYLEREVPLVSVAYARFQYALVNEVGTFGQML